MISEQHQLKRTEVDNNKLSYDKKLFQNRVAKFNEE